MGDTGGETLPPGKLHPCQGWKSVLCQPASRWPQISSFSPNAFSLFPQSDRGWRGVYVTPALASSAPKCPHAHRYVHTHVHTHSCMNSHAHTSLSPGAQGGARVRLRGVLGFLCHDNGLIVQACLRQWKAGGQLQAHLEQPPPTLNPNTTAALLEPGLFS